MRRPLEYDPFLAVADGRGFLRAASDAALGSLGGASLADGLLQSTPTRSTRPRTQPDGVRAPARSVVWCSSWLSAPPVRHSRRLYGR